MQVAKLRSCLSPPKSILPAEAQLCNRSDPEPERTEQSKFLPFPPWSADFRQWYLLCRVAAKPQLRPMIITTYVGLNIFPILALNYRKDKSKQTTPTKKPYKEKPSKAEWASLHDFATLAHRAQHPSGSVLGYQAAWTAPGHTSYTPRAWKTCLHL